MTTEPVCLKDFETIALSKLPKNVADYYRSGAGDEVTLGENISAIKRLKIRPRFLNRDVSKCDTSTTILGHNINFPVCVAPTAMHKMAHDMGEMATAKAASAAGTAYTLSTIATSSIEDIATAAPEGLNFFQMYIYKNRNITLQLLRRAEKNGFKAILLTVDTPYFGKRLADTRNKFVLPSHLKMANFEGLTLESDGLNTSKGGSGLAEYAASLFDASLTWADVKWLKSVTSLPVVVKGILTAEDALEAVNCNVDGILVSNHGGRQLDGAPATIEALPEVVRAVQGRIEVYIDGGVRNGEDVLKCLALGAKAVFIGRPTLFALAYNGEEGVKLMFNILKEEFKLAMALSGCSDVRHINKRMVVHSSYYSKL